jgi:hypothetical protein
MMVAKLVGSGSAARCSHTSRNFTRSAAIQLAIGLSTAVRNCDHGPDPASLPTFCFLPSGFRFPPSAFCFPPSGFSFCLPAFSAMIDVL